jgi:hypothetical protein
VASLAAAARAQAAEAEWTVDNVRWTGALAPATALEIVNPWGDVRLRAADAGEVETSAMAQRRPSDPVRAEVAVERPRGTRRHGGRRHQVLRIEVRYPQPPRGDLHRVDIAVFVPAGAPVTVRTADGMIQAPGLRNDLELETRGGDVVAATSGTVRASSESGDIEVDLEAGAWARAPRLVSSRGDVSLRLAKDVDATARIRARELSLPPSGRVLRRRAGAAVVSFGRGSQTLYVEAPRGGVTLLPPGLS